MKAIQPLMIVTGDNAFLCRRLVRSTMKKAEQEGGLLIEQVEPQSLADSLSGLGSMFGAPSLIYCNCPANTKIDVSLLEKQLAAGIQEPRLLLWLEGKLDERTALAKYLKKLPSKVLVSYMLSVEYKREAESLSFLLDEATKQGYQIATDLCKAVIERVGTDYGILSFELQKMTLLADSEGTKKITPPLVSRSLAPLGDVAAEHLLEALLSRNPKRVQKVLARIRKMTPNSGGAVKEYVGKLQGRVALSLQAANLHARSVDSAMAATQLGQNTWYYENKVLEPVKKLGEKYLTELLLHFAKSDRLVMLGGIDPWLYFESGIFRILQ